MLRNIARFFTKKPIKRSPFLEYNIKKNEERMKKLSSKDVTFCEGSGEFISEIFEQADKLGTKKYP